MHILIVAFEQFLHDLDKISVLDRLLKVSLSQSLVQTISIRGINLNENRKLPEPYTPTEEEIQRITGIIKQHVVTNSYSQIIFPQDEVTQDFANILDAVEKSLSKNNCTGTNLRGFRVNISGKQAPNSPGLSLEYFIEQMRNTLALTTNPYVLNNYLYDTIWEYSADIARKAALYFELKSRVTFVAFDKTTSKHDLLHMRKHLPAANVIEVGSKLNDNKCQIDPDWPEEFIRNAENTTTTSPPGILLFYLPRGIPQQYTIHSLDHMIQKLIDKGYALHFAASQRHIIDLLTKLSEKRPQIDISNLAGLDALSAASATSKALAQQMEKVDVLKKILEYKYDVPSKEGSYCSRKIREIYPGKVEKFITDGIPKKCLSDKNYNTQQSSLDVFTIVQYAALLFLLYRLLPKSRARDANKNTKRLRGPL